MDKFAEMFSQVKRRSPACGGGTALHAAVRGNRPDLVALLVAMPKAAEVVGLVDESGMSPLVLACSLGHHGCLEQLAKHPRVEGRSSDSMGRTAMWHAMSKGHTAIATTLVSLYGPELVQEQVLTDREGRSAWHNVIAWGKSDCAAALVRAVPTSMISSSRVEDLLRLACRTGSSDLFAALFSRTSATSLNAKVTSDTDLPLVHSLPP